MRSPHTENNRGMERAVERLSSDDDCAGHRDETASPKRRRLASHGVDDRDAAAAAGDSGTDGGVVCRLLGWQRDALRVVVWRYLPPTDVASLGATCRELRAFTEDNEWWERCAIARIVELLGLCFLGELARVGLGPDGNDGSYGSYDGNDDGNDDSGGYDDAADTARAKDMLLGLVRPKRHAVAGWLSWRWWCLALERAVLPRTHDGRGCRVVGVGAGYVIHTRKPDGAYRLLAGRFARDGRFAWGVRVERTHICDDGSWMLEVRGPRTRPDGDERQEAVFVRRVYATRHEVVSGFLGELDCDRDCDDSGEPGDCRFALGWLGGGTVEYASGDRYVGEFARHVAYGSGTLWYTNGDRYVGDVKDGLAEGTGVRLYADGGRYVGKFADGERCGKGTYDSPRGDTLYGRWIDDHPERSMVVITGTGAVQRVAYRDGVPHGSPVELYDPPTDRGTTTTTTTTATRPTPLSLQ